MSRKTTNLKKRLRITQDQLRKANKKARAENRRADDLQRIIESFERLRFVDSQLVKSYSDRTWGAQLRISERLIWEISRMPFEDRNATALEIARDCTSQITGMLVKAIRTGEVQSALQPAAPAV